jgi:hypothetical protein
MINRLADRLLQDPFFLGSMGKGRGLFMPQGTLGSCRRSRIEADEVKFIAIQRFPLNRVARIESNRSSQGDWKINI